MWLSWAQLLLGTLVLYLGAEWLVKGAAGLARAVGLRPLIIGLTVVAYGTSAPELTVGVAAALDHRGAIALGNSLGSNIANLGLILGMTALISPPRCDGTLLRRELPVLLLSTALVPLLLLDGTLGRADGVLLLLAALAYTVWMIRGSSAASAVVGDIAGNPEAATLEAASEAAGAPSGHGRTRLALIALVGLALLVGGGKLFVDGAVAIARAFAVSDRVIGLTIVAVGTSLPELATSLVAALRGHSDIAIGNVIGSNIFNVLLILGAAGVTAPLAGSLGAMVPDLTFLVGMTLFATLSMRTARVLSRLEGALLLLAYIAFLLALLLVN